MIDLWKSLKDQLKVEIGVNVREVSDKNSPVEVSFTVTNGASPSSVDHPEILFENLVLTICIPRGSHDVEVGSLSAQDSVTHTEEIPYSELIDMDYNLEGTVSPNAFLRIRKAGTHGNTVGMTIHAYLQLFTELSIHRWLDSTIKSFPVPGPETTLGELSELGNPLREAVLEIRDTERRLQRLASLAARTQDKQTLSQHRGAVESYFRETIQGIGRIQQALRFPDPRTVSSTVAAVVARLDKEAARVMEATDRLSSNFDAASRTTSRNLGHGVNEPTSEVANRKDASRDSWDADGDDENAGRSPNDDRSDSMNPNNEAYQAAMDNRSDQLNPNNPAYHSSRGGR